MPSRPDDDALFIRSLATPSGQSGVAPNVDLMIGLFDDFGFDTVIVETVGAGQGDTAIRDVADVVIVLVQPETGDELQWEKAGQLEIADIVVVHKADLPSAERAYSQLRELLNLPGCRPLPVVRVSSSKGLGVEELWAAVDACPGRPRRRCEREKKREPSASRKEVDRWLGDRAYGVGRRQVRSRCIQPGGRDQKDAARRAEMPRDMLRFCGGDSVSVRPCRH